MHVSPMYRSRGDSVSHVSRHGRGAPDLGGTRDTHVVGLPGFLPGFHQRLALRLATHDARYSSPVAASRFALLNEALPP
jgi:hypothetical protein